MNKKEKAIKSRLKNYELPMNGMDQEALWNSISKEVSSPSAPANYSLLIKLVSAALLVAGSITYFAVQQSSENDENKTLLGKTYDLPYDLTSHNAPTETVTKEIETIFTQRAIENTSQNEQLNSTNHTLNKQWIHTDESTNQTSSKSRKSQKDALHQMSSSKSIATTAHNSGSLTNPQPSLHNENNLPVISSSTKFSEPYSPNPELSDSNNNSRTIFPKNPIDNLELAEVLNTKPLTVDRNKETLIPSQLTPPINLEKKSNLSMSISSGMNLLTFGYSGAAEESLQERSNSEELSIGFSNGINIEWNFKPDFSLRSSVELHSYWSKLDYSASTSISYVNPDALLKVYLDANTRDTLGTERGPKLIKANSINRIVHHNKYSVLSFPLELGYHIHKDHFQCALGLGISYNITRRQEGRTLDSQAQVVSFTQSDSVAPFKRNFIAMRIRPKMTYSLDNHWSISLEPFVQFSKGRNFDNSEIKVNIQQLHLNAGLQYHFN